MAAAEAPKTKLATMFSSANKFDPGANPVENSKMLKKWVFAYVNKAAGHRRPNQARTGEIREVTLHVR
jgi:hypothetical protein